MSKQLFVYRLLPPRPGFAFDMSPAEAEAMERHSTYWQELLARGTAVFFGPVDDPAGVWGLGVVEADSLEDVHAVRERDPAVTSGTARAEVHAVLGGFVRPLSA
ncbi:YciI family protein [Motilibacter deserti]|uniref:YCII-related domain-containing protein n=1 Tax=Motilibacter deserti TaxID=2714956 RepID=A0ABX0GS03_9ACTN|nr:YciI family protein [Motilibacter deserti]NHC12464.1 hypothetical protein [Motilibacter deserti]